MYSNIKLMREIFLESAHYLILSVFNLSYATSFQATLKVSKLFGKLPFKIFPLTCNYAVPTWQSFGDILDLIKNFLYSITYLYIINTLILEYLLFFSYFCYIFKKKRKTNLFIFLSSWWVFISNKEIKNLLVF